MHFLSSAFCASKKLGSDTGRGMFYAMPVFSHQLQRMLHEHTRRCPAVRARQGTACSTQETAYTWESSGPCCRCSICMRDMGRHANDTCTQISMPCITRAPPFMQRVYRKHAHKHAGVARNAYSCTYHSAFPCHSASLGGVGAETLPPLLYKTGRSDDRGHIYQPCKCPRCVEVVHGGH